MPSPRDAYSYRTDHCDPGFADDKPVIIFDGHCVLCSRWAMFVVRHDPAARYPAAAGAIAARARALSATMA